jgi:hypothetical protein
MLARDAAQENPHMKRIAILTVLVLALFALSSEAQTGRYKTPVKYLFSLANATASAQLSSGTFTAFDPEVPALYGDLNITAVTGTNPTLDILLECSTDGGSHYYTVASFAQKTGTGSDSKVFGPVTPLCRWKYSIGGTNPRFTYTITSRFRHVG